MGWGVSEGAVLFSISSSNDHGSLMHISHGPSCILAHSSSSLENRQFAALSRTFPAYTVHVQTRTWDGLHAVVCMFSV